MTVIDLKRNIVRSFTKDISIAPLVTFRIIFGVLMLFSTIRFLWNDWVHELYILPDFHFKYLGFEWVQALPGNWMYAPFMVMIICSVGILLGFFYRFSAMLFFLAFTYVELIDKANYLNHYYFVSLISFLLVFIPANRRFSLDVLFGRTRERLFVSPVYRNILIFQISVVYFFAGLAKINPDWLLHAQPLKMWLSAHIHDPIIGGLFRYEHTAFVFSWAGMLFDIFTPFLLLISFTRKIAYFIVAVFHILTWWLFPIGVFPWVMIGLTLIFFQPEAHDNFLTRCVKLNPPVQKEGSGSSLSMVKKYALIGFVLFQVAMPMRHLLYPGDLFWTEEGYRFSWRVMLMEKAGSAQFQVVEPPSSRSIPISNYQYLSANQEKMMSTQPDMILQFAHFLKSEYEAKGVPDPEVRANVFVTLNGSRRQLLVDPKVDLTDYNIDLRPKSWIMSR